MEISIGCDPELLYLNQDRHVVPARNIVQNAAGPNGCDGCSDVGEYRPGSGQDNAELVDKIRKVMRDEIRNNPKILKYLWWAGPNREGYSLGGHIHFGMPREHIHANLATCATCAKLVKVLDVFMAIPWIYCEYSASGRARKRDYGYLSNVEVKPWGFEYRTLSTWLGSDDRAFAVLGTAQAIAWLHLNNPDALARLYFQAGHDLTVEERSNYRAHQTVSLSARKEKVLASLWAMRELVEKPEWKRAITMFYRMTKRGTKREVFMDWYIDGEKLSTKRQKYIENEERIEAENRARIHAEAINRDHDEAIRENNSRNYTFPTSFTMENAWNYAAWTLAEAPPIGPNVHLNLSDHAIQSIFGRYSGTVARSEFPIPNIMLYGRIQEARCEITIKHNLPADSEIMLRLNKAVEYLRTNRGYTIEVIHSTDISMLSVGFRRDIRENEPNSCGRAFQVIALSLAGKIQE